MTGTLETVQSVSREDSLDKYDEELRLISVPGRSALFIASYRC